MEVEESKRRAWGFFQQAYDAQMKGELDKAANLYRESIAACPTAEAYTFLGWTYSFKGDLDAAIEECHKAIAVDPDFGNPYNDIGAYLIEKGQLDEAIPWLEKAVRSRRYDSYSFPWMNLARVWERKGEWYRAMDCLKQALKCNPRYEPAARALARIRGLLN